jgi:uncharacterized membrane protein YeaQ/YmgE (transglycosylase-associated protein family)
MVEAVVGSVVSGVVGKALGGGSTQQATQSSYETVPGTEFQPYTYRSLGSTVTGTPEGDYGFNTSVELDPTLVNLAGLGASSAETFYNQLPALYARPEAVYDQTYDPAAAQKEYYETGLAQLQPEFLKQQIQAQERMFGSGRLGLKLAGEGLGAPTGTGAVSPDAFGLGAAQSKALADLYAGSVDAGRAAEIARLEQETNIFNRQQTAEADYLNRILGGAQGMFGLAGSIRDIESAARSDALAQEVARSNALKQGTTSYYQPKSTTEAILANSVAGQVGTAAADWITGNTGNSGMFSNYSTSPVQAYNNWSATGSLGGNFGYGTNNSLMTSSPTIGSSGYNANFYMP